MNQSEWARNEIEIAKKHMKGEDSGYINACYDSALKAFDSICEDGHSGMSFSITKSILIRLMNGNPLTPIEDNEAAWKECWGYEGKPFKMYQCTRMSSLFKQVNDDGSIEYDDIDRIKYLDLNANITNYFGFLKDITKKYIPPITMPYMPPSEPYLLGFKDFWYKHPEETGAFDHIEVVLFQAPGMLPVYINRYFREVCGNLVECTEKEYHEDYYETFGDRGDRRYDR